MRSRHCRRSRSDKPMQRAVLSNRSCKKCVDSGSPFNVSLPSAFANLLPSYERDAIRPHVLGHFRDMLLATARHPAMFLPG